MIWPGAGVGVRRFFGVNRFFGVGFGEFAGWRIIGAGVAFGGGLTIGVGFAVGAGVGFTVALGVAATVGFGVEIGCFGEKVGAGVGRGKPPTGGGRPNGGPLTLPP
jgi:hypothetical protein